MQKPCTILHKHSVALHPGRKATHKANSRPESEGCIRIPASLNVFIDHYGILDADYERAMKLGQEFSVLLDTREPTPWSGKFMVVVDTGRSGRPAWSPAPEDHR
jgi:hypothetical protein